MDFCERFCLQNQISEPTRVTEKTMTLLDVILASHLERYATCGNLHMGSVTTISFRQCERINYQGLTHV